MNSTRTLGASFAMILVLSLPGGFRAGETPDLEMNTATGFVESVDIDPASAGRVRHVEDEGQGGIRTETLISTAAGASPRIAITASGDSCAVWWTAANPDEVHYRCRESGTGDWTGEQVLSSSGEASRNPEIVHRAAETWIAYEIVGAASTAIAVLGIIDDPDPLPIREVLATTGFSGDVDVLIQSELDHVWVTWVDDGTHVAWTEYNPATGTWDALQYESYAADTIAKARKRIRGTILDD